MLCTLLTVLVCALRVCVVQVGTFAVEQAKSLVLALRLEGRDLEYALPEREVVEALGRVLPDEEIQVVVTFLHSTAKVSVIPSDFAPPREESTPRKRPGGESIDSTASDESDLFATPGQAVPDRDFDRYLSHDGERQPDLRADLFAGYAYRAPDQRADATSPMILRPRP